MADSIYTFDPTPGNNTALDSIPYGPNQLYHNQIDNWFRALGSKLAQFVDDLGAVNTVAGTGDAVTVTLASGITAYATGQFFRFIAGAANTGAATMNVNSIGAKAIRKISAGSDVALSAGDIAAGETYFVIYRASANAAAGGWILIGGAAVAAATTSAAGIVELATTTEASQASSSTLAVTPAGLANLYSTALGLAIEVADLKGSRLNMAGGIADAYDSETDVDTATSTNESYDSVNDLYSPSATETRITGATPTAPNFGGTAANFNDNNTGTSLTTSALGDLNAAGTGARIIAKLDLGSNKTVTKISAVGLSESSATSTMTAVYSTDDSTWSTLGAGLSVTTSPTTFDRTGSVTARYVAIAAQVTAYGSITVTLQDLNAYESSAANMTLVSNSFTASAVPTQARVAVFIDPQESITINTDFTAEASRDGGTTWTAITLALVSNPVGTVEQYEGSVSISGQPSGSSMKYRLKTLNNKDIDVTGTVFQWS